MFYQIWSLLITGKYHLTQAPPPHHHNLESNVWWSKERMQRQCATALQNKCLCKTINVYRWRSSYQQDRFGIQQTGLSPRHMCVPVPSHDLNFQRHMLLSPGLSPPHVCACPKAAHEYSTSYVLVLFVFRGDCSFVDIGGIVDHQCLCYEFEPRLWRGVLDTTLYDKVCQ
jgi:hypothetical protein